MTSHRMILRQAGREVPEWVGSSPDTPIPPRVKARVFEKYGGRCYRSGKLIRAGDKWQCDHVLAIINGGRNIESNLAPILLDVHKEKTRDDLAVKGKIARIRAKHLGLWPKSRSRIAGRGFPKGRNRMEELNR